MKLTPNRHGEWDKCHRCGYPAQISQSQAYGGYLAQQPDGLVICWNGRECALRLRRNPSTERTGS